MKAISIKQPWASLIANTLKVDVANKITEELFADRSYVISLIALGLSLFFVCTITCIFAKGEIKLLQLAHR